MTKQCDCRC